ncbi:MAG: hypothetical protein H5T62_13170 [Anaerolineae bacterium]|nr:hypothetical protein [Anaerolineae bacterium]
MIEHSQANKWRELEVMITVKAYPNPSRKYVEASCTAGITRDGQWIRLYPVKFRTLDSEQQFSKYTWVRVRVCKASDPRPESFTVDMDSIQVIRRVGTAQAWAERKAILYPLRDLSMCSLQSAREAGGRSLGFIRPKEIIRLEIRPTSPHWTPAELACLRQQSFFDADSSPAELEKIPYDFFYHFRCEDPHCNSHRMKVVDWEICQSYRSWFQRYGDDWQEKLREKYERQMRDERDTHFFVGTMLKHPQSWIIVGLFYPPKVSAEQMSLL